MPRKAWSTSPSFRTRARSPLFRRSTKPGPAPGPETTENPPAPPEAPSPNAWARSISATSAMDTDSIATPSERLPSSSSAEHTLPSSPASTVWTMSLRGYVENGSMTRITLQDAKALGEANAAKLRMLAEGRAETVDDTVRAIVTFFEESQDGILNEDLGTAVSFYLEHYVL